MNANDVREIGETIKFGGLFRDVKLTLDLDDGSDAVRIRFHLRVPERDTGEPISLNFVDLIPMEALKVLSADDVVTLVQKAFRRFARHEADEAFVVGGVRRSDPHEPGFGQ